MARDQKVLGIISIVFALLCCLPVVCLFALILFAGTYTTIQPGYAYTADDETTLIVFGVALAIGLLGLIAFLAGGIWAVRNARRTEKQEDEYFETLK